MICQHMLSRGIQRVSNERGTASQPGVTFEALEPRVLLSAPEILNHLYNQIVPDNGYGVTFAINGYDEDGDALTITAQSNDPNLQVYTTSGNPFARITFVDHEGEEIGEILIELFDQRAPIAVERFIELATNPDHGQDGNPYYTDILVHRVVPGFVIQTGDHTGTGSGSSPLGKFKPENPKELSFAGPGAIAWANSGNNIANSDSQFFITAGATPDLNDNFSPFGQLVSGWDVYNQIINTPTQSGTQRPVNPPVMKSVEIIDSPQDASVTLVAGADWDGDAEVTITLDDGNGNITTQTIRAVSPRLIGTIEKTPSFLITKPSTKGEITVKPTLPAEINVFSDTQGTIVAYNPNTNIVEVTPPPAYTGLIQVIATVMETGFDPRVLSVPSTKVISAFSVAPASLTALGHAPTGVTGAALSSQIDGDRLYVANSAGFEVWDISDSGEPQLLGRRSITEIGQTVQVRDIQIIEASKTVFITNTGGGFATLDVSDPTNIKLLDQEFFFVQTAAAISAQVVGGVAYVAEFGNGLVAYDISNPADVRVIGGNSNKIKLPDIDADNNPARAMDVAVVGNRAYVTYLDGRMAVVDISTPASMSNVATVNVAFQPWGIAAQGNRLYIADGGIDEVGALRVLDISNPNAPKQIGLQALPGTARQIAVRGDLAVVGLESGPSIAFVNISNPSNMSVFQTFSSRRPDEGVILGGSNAAFDDQGRISLSLGLAGVAIVQDPREVIAFDRNTTLVDGNGVSISVSARNADVYAAIDANGNIERLFVENADDGVVNIRTRGGNTTIGEILVTGSLRNFNARTVDLAGDFTASGAVTRLMLNDVIDSTITMGSGDRDAQIQGNIFTNVAIDSAAALRMVRITDWRDNTGNSSISAPGINQINSRGDFGGDIITTNQGIRTIRANGTITGGSWQIKGDVNQIRAGGNLANTNLDIQGDVRQIQAGGNITEADWDIQGHVNQIRSGGDITDANWDIQGDVRQIRAGSLKNWQANIVGEVRNLTASGDLQGDLTASVVATIRVNGAIRGGVFHIAGDVRQIRAGDIADNWRSNIKGELRTLNVTNHMQGTLAAQVIGRINVRGDLKNSTILAGADLGQDAQIGGTGSNADTYSQGTIAGINIGGKMTQSTIAAGRDGDAAVGGEESSIRSIRISDTMDNSSLIAAGALPNRIRVGSDTIDPMVDQDDRFKVLPPKGQ